jgi:hypothetical protein
MTAPKHTPGPWVSDGFNVWGPEDSRSEHPNGRTLIGGVVDDANDWRGKPLDNEPRGAFAEETKANARLIAAAPELRARVEASNALIDWLMDHAELRPYLENTEGVWQRLCDDFDANGAAIAQAGGSR